MRISQTRTIQEDLYLTDDTIYKITTTCLMQLLHNNVSTSYQLNDAIYMVLDALNKKREKNGN